MIACNFVLIECHATDYPLSSSGNRQSTHYWRIAGAEDLRDKIENLKAEVGVIMRQGNVQMADHYYKYSAPSLDRKYTKSRVSFCD